MRYNIGSAYLFEQVNNNNMPLKEELEITGNWLFRRRSWLPLLLYPYAVAIIYFYIEPSYHSITNLLWSLFCLAISLTGLFIRVLTIGYTPEGTSGRNTEDQVADSLNQTGMYSIVRHPLYLGNFIMWFGLFMYTGTWWFTVSCCLLFWIYYERIMLAEEEFLRKKYCNIYESWATKTPLFIPNFSSWISPDLAFSIKTVLKREYNGLFALLVSFSIINGASNLFHNGKFALNSLWQLVLFMGLAIFLVLRFLKKKTNMLDVAGR